MMKYRGQKDILGAWGEAPPAHFSGDEANVFRFGADPSQALDPIGVVATGGPATVAGADLTGPPASEPVPEALTGSEPRAKLNETPGLNDDIGNAQVIDRNGLTVTNNPNFYDTTLPTVVINGAISSSSDQDYYSIVLQAGELLLLDVDGTNGLDSLLHLYGPNGSTEIGDQDDYVISDPGSQTAVSLFGHNTDSLIHFRALTAGTYYFSIQSFQDQPTPTTGAYQINVSIGPPGTAAQIAAEDLLALQSGASFNHTSLTYGIPVLVSQYPANNWTEINPTSDFSAFNGTQRAATDQLLQMIASVTNLTFTQNSSAPGQADIRYAMTSDSAVGNTAYAYYPTNGGPSSKGSTAWFSTTNFSNPIKGNYAYMGILHETGHALGLKHGQEFPIALSADHDSVEFSVMTYRSYPGAPLTGYTIETWGYAQTPMMYDIAALQAMYGANFTTNSGNSVYSWNPSTGEMSINGVGQGAPGGNRILMTIWDGGGTDTYDMSNYGSGVSIDLTPGGWSTTSAVQLSNLDRTASGPHYARGNVFNALQYQGDPRSLIENAIGGAGNDTIIGNAADNRLEGRGGNDQLYGMDGNDAFFFTTDFNALDHVDGGAGNNDQIGLQGDYAGANALILGANTITNVEVIAVLAGFSYDITTVDANVAAGGLLKVQATLLQATESLTFNGSLETDGSFIVYGGQGNDNFTGGAGNDGFYFGPGGFTAADIINGGGGANDQLALDGNYTITMGANNNVTGIEVLVLLPGPVGSPNNFNVTLLDPFVAAGQTMTVFGLQVSTGITFNGSAEHDASFRIYGGSNDDTLTGGTGNDWFFGGVGSDNMTGGSGADTFYYDDVSQSTAARSDSILGFAAGDKIDVSGIDAIAGGANDAFTFLGAGAFTNHAGELRAVNTNANSWLVQGDTNGDGVADFQLTFTNGDAHPITSADFIL